MLVEQIGQMKDLEAPTRALIAVVRDLDGALRDIRAVRSTIDAVVSDADLRDPFKDWLSEGQ